MANWAEINQDIFSLIIRRVTNPSDHIRISGVCSSWRSVAKQYRSNLSNPIPGLVFATREPPQKRKFLNFSSPSVAEFDLIVPRRHRCCGSHKGWLVLIKEDGNSMYLLNPFIKRCRLLPNLSTIGTISDVDKAVMSCSPSIDPICVVLILFGHQGAAFCKVGDQSWTKLQDSCDCYLPSYSAFSDALFYEGRFYLVDDYGKIYSCNLGRRFFEEISSQPSEITKIRHKWYLVELKGIIHRVQRKFSSNEEFYFENIQNNEVNNDNAISGSTCEFRVWRMDPGLKQWVRVRDLGEFALFLGCNNSVGIELEVYGIKGNRVYFTDDRQRIKHFGCIWPGKDMGMFDLSNSSIQPLCWTQFEWLTDLPAFWVAPLPW